MGPNRRGRFDNYWTYQPRTGPSRSTTCAGCDRTPLFGHDWLCGGGGVEWSVMRFLGWDGSRGCCGRHAVIGYTLHESGGPTMEGHPRRGPDGSRAEFDGHQRPLQLIRSRRGSTSIHERGRGAPMPAKAAGRQANAHNGSRRRTERSMGQQSGQDWTGRSAADALVHDDS